MVLAADADVLVHWAMEGASRHRAARRLFEAEVARGGRLGLTLQVLFEFIHVASDPRRFEWPLPMASALSLAHDLWDARETERIVPAPQVFSRTEQLMTALALGRKRILDTALAATLESAGVRRLATLNGRDYKVFDFLEVVTP